MEPEHGVSKQDSSSTTKPAKKSDFDVVLESIRDELKRDYAFYEEGLLGAIRAKAAGGDPTPW